jgi:hypothetical protein
MLEAVKKVCHSECNEAVTQTRSGEAGLSIFDHFSLPELRKWPAMSEHTARRNGQRSFGFAQDDRLFHQSLATLTAFSKIQLCKLKAKRS